MSTSLQFRRAAMRRIEKRFNELRPLGMKREAACIIWSVATATVIREMNKRAIIQAGSMSWPMIRPEQDDGKRMTHFSYVWEPDSETTRRCLDEGRLPEVHVWVALPDDFEIVDVTTKFLPIQAKALAGFDWPGDVPPRYLWTAPNKLPKGVIYAPRSSAMRIVLSYIANPEIYARRAPRKHLYEIMAWGES